jgi:hypothetical protein
MAPSFSDCTDQTDVNYVDLPIGINSDICDGRSGFGTGVVINFGSFVGHVNWFPVTFEGTAGWGDHNGDDDYSFTFFSDPGTVPPGVNGRTDLHVEFDSDETIANFTVKEWSDLKQAVDDGDKQLAGLRFDGHTIVTGMFGLDGEHDLKSELHPLYAIATKLAHFDAPSDEVWLMFVRNRGDEGFCSSQL